MSSMSFSKMSYARHAAHFDRDLTDEKRIATAQTWFKKDTADYWRHARMYEAVDCLISEPDTRWLTIGDGRFGLDSIRIREKGFTDVTPTDISEALLRRSKEEGRIEKYKIENAENLTFQSEEFDYVFCKESYHHFPQPLNALYEMIRVARKAVLLTEPNDISGSPFHILKHGLKSILKGYAHPDAANYEESGNYVYSVSKRELEKVALGLNLPMIATKGLSDHFIDGCEHAPASWKNPIYRRIRVKCALRDAMAYTRFHEQPLLMAVIFKSEPTELVLARLKQLRWNVVRLPRNPYAG
jgi:ubiquinone/menaquinone biosynthesis C-methylase UbiE